MNKNRKLIYFLMMISIIGLFAIGCDNEGSSDTGGKSYKGSATGYGGEVTVDVTVSDDGKINAIDVDAPAETAEVGGKAATKIAEQIITEQSLSVDAVAGATITSNAVLSATEAALKEGGIDTSAYKK